MVIAAILGGAVLLTLLALWAQLADIDHWKLFYGLWSIGGLALLYGAFMVGWPWGLLVIVAGGWFSSSIFDGLSSQYKRA